jgi:hypothetical protein
MSETHVNYVSSKIALSTREVKVVDFRFSFSLEEQMQRGLRCFQNGTVDVRDISIFVVKLKKKNKLVALCTIIIIIIIFNINKTLDRAVVYLYVSYEYQRKTASVP